MTKADGSYIREISRIEKQDLLILDDFGIQPLDNQSRFSINGNYRRQTWKAIHDYYFTITCKGMV